MNGLSNDVLLRIENFVKRGKVRSTKPRKHKVEYGASTHNLRNLLLTKDEYNRVLNNLNKRLPGGASSLNTANRWPVINGEFV